MQSKLAMHRGNDAERGHAAGALVSHRLWRTGAAGCTAERHRAHQRVIRTPSSRGRYTAEAIARRREIAELIRAARDLFDVA